MENAPKSWKLSAFVKRKTKRLSVDNICSPAINLATRHSHVVITSAFRHATQGKKTYTFVIVRKDKTILNNLFFQIVHVENVILVQTKSILVLVEKSRC